MVSNKTNYVETDVLRTFLRIPMSRSKLVKELELGEGTIRSILDVLKDKGLLDSSNKGHYLNTAGQSFISQLKKKMDFAKKVRLSTYKSFKAVGIVLKNIKFRRPGFKERDIAVKCGAEGALLLRKGFKIEGYHFIELEKKFRLRKNDLLVVCFANSHAIAENAALEVASNLNKNIMV